MTEYWIKYWTTYLWTHATSHGPQTLMFFDPIAFAKEQREYL